MRRFLLAFCLLLPGPAGAAATFTVEPVTTTVSGAAAPSFPCRSDDAQIGAC